MDITTLLVYLDAVSHGNTGWPVETIVDGLPDIENVTEALQNGPYGKCVYESDNDVCDHQVVHKLLVTAISINAMVGSRWSILSFPTEAPRPSRW